MSATSRELVTQTLDFRNPARVPRQLWALPWAGLHYPTELSDIRRAYPDDIIGVGGHLRETPPTQGDPHRIGTYVDEWGCTFQNVQDGVIGEVKEPRIRDWDTDAAQVHIPREWLTLDRDAVNRDCAATDRFTMAGACPRPFEQLQFLRGSEPLYMDLCDPTPAMRRFMADMHAFYCELLQAWARTDVDALMFMDDWGAQRSLLIRPALWRELFKPLYRDFVQIAHGAGKKLFMHSDGHILAIYSDLVELGIDAVNSQLFCMGVENLAPYAGKITFWGEIDRQHLLPHATTEEIEQAVRQVHSHLWANGGCIAQCEFGAGAKPENVRQVFASWNSLI
jgi:uroporphyrinogen decarboxylase